VLAPLPKKLVAIEHYRMLGKRGEPEKVRIVTALTKQETPRKCLAIHAGFTKKVGPMDNFFQSKKQKTVVEEEKLELQSVGDRTLFENFECYKPG
jgi:hypothetical protein